MSLEWRCTFNFKSLPSGTLQDPYLSRVHGFLKQFEGEEFDNNHDFESQLGQWPGYLSRQQLDPQLPGPKYDVRSNSVHVAVAGKKYCSFGGLFYIGNEERSSL